MKELLIFIILGLFIASALFIYRKKRPKSYFQIFLHFLLFGIIYLLLFPVVKNTTKTEGSIAIYDSNETKKAIFAKKDSLHLKEFYMEKEFKKARSSGKIKEKNIVLAGTSFDFELLASLKNYNVEHWVNFKKDEVQNLKWDALKKTNETQIVKFTVDASKAYFAKLKLGNTTLDSVLLKPGLQSAELTFPVFTIGRNETVLELSDSKIQVRFYAQKPAPLHIAILTAAPDFESKTLAEWLNKQGHKVQLITDLSTNINTEINFQNSKKTNKLDLLICTPNKLASGLRTKAKDVFVMGLENTNSDIAKINVCFGVDFQLKKDGEQLKTLKNGVELLPYSFIPKNSQFFAPEYQIVSQANRVGVTLLQSTYPLILSGDSLTYAKIWSNLFQLFPQKIENDFQTEAPIFPFEIAKITIPTDKDSVKIDGENHLLENKTAHVIFKNSGWKTLADSLEIHVDSSAYFYSRLRQTRQNLSASPFQLQNIASEEELLPKEILLLLFFITYGLIWYLARKN
jgi:hypothetical protein